MRKGLLALLLLLMPALVFAQAETTGRVQGRVVDEQGNAVAGATITLTSPALQGERSFTADENGRYLASLLPPGTYTMSVEADGMSPAEYTFRVGVGQTRPLDITLKRGVTMTEEVTVYGDVSKLETTAGGENFDYQASVNELPIVNRDPERVAELAPNVSFGPTPNTLSIAGAPSFDTVVLLDGAEVSDPYFGSAPQVWVEEAIEEVQVLTSGISARYGRFQGGVINATTKSGGNTFDGSARVDLSKESWNEKTPFSTETQSDNLNKVYSATLGGPILKDRLWFFISGRTIPTLETTDQTIETSQNFVTSRDEDRWQVKLTGAINPNHILEGSFLKFDAASVNRAGLPAGELRALGKREDPRETTTLEYQGVLSDTTFVNAQGTMKRVSIMSGGDPAGLSPVIENLGSSFQVVRNHWWDFADPSDRDNDTLGASVTHVLSTGDWGDHTIEGGVQYVNSKTGGENRQSPTGFNYLNYDQFVSPGAKFSDYSDPANPTYDILSLADGGFAYRWIALPLGGGQELKNTAVYAQDTWERGRWRLDLGLRWEQWDGEGPEPTLDLDFDEVSPRLGATYNLDNNWQLQMTWGKYISRFNDNVASSITGVGGAPYVVQIYTGPTLNNITDLELEDIIRSTDPADWGLTVAVSDPAQPTRFLTPGTSAPYANEWNFTVKRALPRNTGSFTLGYTDRTYKDLLDDFVGDFGTTTVIDPLGSGTEIEVDTTIWTNSDFARREYQAVTSTIDYRPSAVWSVGGNYTYAKTRGNYEGEGRNTPSSGSIIGDYPRSLPLGDAAPFGYTDDDIRHRVRAWGNYRLDFGRIGTTTLGLVGLYQSGLPWSMTAGRPLADDPVYLGDAGTSYTHYFGPRGGQRFSGFHRLDFSARHQIAVWRDVNAYLKLTVLNVLDRDELLTHSTSGTSVLNQAGLRVWAPQGRGIAPGTDIAPTVFVNPADPEDTDAVFIGTFEEIVGGPEWLQGLDFAPAVNPYTGDPIIDPISGEQLWMSTYDPDNPNRDFTRLFCFDNPHENCSAFGDIRSAGDYQLPRSYFVSVGFQW